MSIVNPALAAQVTETGVPVSADHAEPKLRTLDQVEDELTGVCLSLHEEELETARLRLALKSAKRRALRRLPHEREGLIFHLERENRQLHAFVRVANEAAQVSARGWEQYSGEVTQLREENARLRARVSELEAERHTTNEALDDAVQALRADRAEPVRGPSAAESADRLTAFFAPVASLREEPVAEAVTPRVQAMRALLDGQRAAVEDPHDGPLHHSYRVPRDLPEIGGA